jgi:hypothetical protein
VLLQCPQRPSGLSCKRTGSSQWPFATQEVWVTASSTQTVALLVLPLASAYLYQIKTTTEYRRFVRPLLQKLNDLGIQVPIPTVQRYLTQPLLDEKGHKYEAASLSKRLLGETTGHTLIASRLFPRTSFSNPSTLESSHLAIRHVIENSSLTFHGMNYAPTLSVSANPNNAVNPAFRTTVLRIKHALGRQSSDLIA